MNKIWINTKVIQGKKLARKVGFPTVNLELPENISLKRIGVYAARVQIFNKIYSAIAYYGPRLLQKEKEIILEAHIFDFSQEVYGEDIQISFGCFVRPPIEFSSLKEFKKQLKEDCAKAKEMLLYASETDYL